MAEWALSPAEMAACTLHEEGKLPLPFTHHPLRPYRSEVPCLFPKYLE